VTKPTSWFVVAIVAAVGLLDVVTGFWLLVSPTPWTAHGPGTVWLQAPDLVARAPEAASLIDALFRRTGAFSLHAGVVTIVAAWLGRRHRTLMTGLLVVWMIDGLAFFLTDRAAFAGTTYLVAKQVIGSAWALAFVVHLVQGRKAA
jgi:uncharacterized protein YjeT (DUF2065 family)